jgi:hypothetical protein
MRAYRAIPILVALLPEAARAQDPFEIQVYDAETAPRGKPGIELHANYFALGTTTIGPGTVLPTDRVFHLTFEPHLGVAGWAEVGGYLQTAARPDGSCDFAGAKARFKARLPRRLAGHVGVAVNTELSAIPSAYSESRFGTELRPIIDLRIDHAYFSFNPIVDFDFEGDLAGRPQFEPAAKADVILLQEHLGLGIEYYSALGTLSQQVHRLFGVVDITEVSAGPVRLGLNFGVGYGLAAGERLIVKSIIGVEVQ